MTFESLGVFIHRHRRSTLVLAALFFAAAIALLFRGGALTSGTIHGLESERADALVEEVVGHPSNTTFVAIVEAPDQDVGSAAFVDGLEKTVAPLRTDAHVLSVVTPADAPSFQASMVNASAHDALVLVTLRGDLKEALASYPDVRAELGKGPFHVTATGHVPFVHDMNTTLAHDLFIAELISLPLALLVLVLVFRTWVAAFVPVGVGALAVAGGIAAVFGLSHSVDIAEYTVNICSLIGLGLAIDYSLFIVSRYREELAKGLNIETALSKTLGSAGRMVTFSGLAVGTGLAGLLFFRGSYLVPMGIGGMIVVALAVLFAITFLPALLAVLGRRIGGNVAPREPNEGPTFWRRVALGVMRRPWHVLVPTLAVLVAMGLPFLHLRMSAADVRVLTGEVEARRGYDELLQNHPQQSAERVVIAVRFPGKALAEERIGALYDLSRRVGSIPHVTRVESIVDLDPRLGKREYAALLTHPPAEMAGLIGPAVEMSVHDDVVLLNAVIDAPPDSEAARGVVRRIREYRSVGDGTLVVGGRIAMDVDATSYIVSRAPYAIGFVIAATFAILFVLLGSVVLPIKAVLMNLLSIAGSFGALVYLFQDGHLFVHDPRPLEPSLPVLLFCVLFGLSMDYEVLMLTRIKEARDRTGDDTLAVAEGLEKTAGLITSAAAIMIAVFAAFAMARVVVVQAVGVGMALAVFVDATIVRVLLVPSTMRLLGALNWWAPKSLLRLRERLHLTPHHA